MKYEMIFGDEKLFDGAPLDSVCVECFINPELVSVYVHYRTIDALLNTLIEREAVSCASNRPDIAIRRIIAEPKRWTWEDKKAGRLPEVGCLVATIPNFDCAVVGVDEDRKNIAIQYENGKLDVVRVHCVSPIETPEEKAARLCNEWCKTAADIFVRHPSRSGTESMEGIYKAMLSGDLPVPVKVE